MAGWQNFGGSIFFKFSVCLSISLGLASPWPTEGIPEKSLPEDRQTWKSVEVKSEVCRCSVAVRPVEKPQGWDPTYSYIRNTSIPAVPGIDITAPIDNHHIGANSPPISVTGLMIYLQVSLRLANVQKLRNSLQKFWKLASLPHVNLLVMDPLSRASGLWSFDLRPLKYLVIFLLWQKWYYYMLTININRSTHATAELIVSICSDSLLSICLGIWYLLCGWLA